MIIPSPFLSKREKASWNASLCSSVSPSMQLPIPDRKSYTSHAKTTLVTRPVPVARGETEIEKVGEEVCMLLVRGASREI